MFISFFISFSFRSVSYSLYLYLSLSLSLYIVSLCAANYPNICRLHRFLYICLYGYSFYFQQQNGAYIMFILHAYLLTSLDNFVKYYLQQEKKQDLIKKKMYVVGNTAFIILYLQAFLLDKLYLIREKSGLR